MFEHETYMCLGLPDCSNEVGIPNGICRECIRKLDEKNAAYRQDVNFSTLADLVTFIQTNGA